MATDNVIFDMGDCYCRNLGKIKREEHNMGTKLIVKLVGGVLAIIGAGTLVLRHPVEVGILVVGVVAYYVADKYLI